MIPLSQRRITLLMAAICWWWVSLALRRTDRMAEKLETTPAEVRALGARDIVSALSLTVMLRDPRPALAARAIFDLHDTHRFGKGKSDLAAMTLGSAGIALVGLLSRR